MHAPPVRSLVRWSAKILLKSKEQAGPLVPLVSQCEVLSESPLAIRVYPAYRQRMPLTEVVQRIPVHKEFIKSIEFDF
jgi:hypothetical protein